MTPNFSARSKGLQQRTEGPHRARGHLRGGDGGRRRANASSCYLADTWGIRSTLRASGAGRKAILVFNNAETAKLQALIAPDVHPSMEYKVLPRFRGLFRVEPTFEATRYELMAMPVTDVRVKPKTRSMHRFDIEVEDSHNYLVDGVMVHNSPEVTAGWACAEVLLLDSSGHSPHRVDQGRHRGRGQPHPGKVVKNKCAAPFKQAEFDIMYGQGISREGSVLDVAVELGFVKKAGAWFTYEGEQLGQGRENVKTFLRENPQLMAELDGRVREHLARP